MKYEEIVAGGVYSSDGKTAVRVLRVKEGNRHQARWVIFWEYVFWDRAEELPTIEYRDPISRFARWAKMRLTEYEGGCGEECEVDSSS